MSFQPGISLLTGIRGCCRNRAVDGDWSRYLKKSAIERTWGTLLHSFELLCVFLLRCLVNFPRRYPEGACRLPLLVSDQGIPLRSHLSNLLPVEKPKTEEPETGKRSHKRDETKNSC